MRLISVHLPLKDVLRAPKLILSPFDIVILKMSFRTRPQEALRIAQTIRGAVNDKRMIYFRRRRRSLYTVAGNSPVYRFVC